MEKKQLLNAQNISYLVTVNCITSRIMHETNKKKLFMCIYTTLKTLVNDIRVSKSPNVRLRICGWSGFFVSITCANVKCDKFGSPTEGFDNYRAQITKMQPTI